MFRKSICILRRNYTSLTAVPTMSLFYICMSLPYSSVISGLRRFVSPILTNLVVDGTGIMLTYICSTDGSTHECDVLVGADGVRSFVRQTILGKEHPAASSVNSGWWAIWTLQSYEEGRELLGKGHVDIEDAREYAWTGDGTFLMHNLLSQGELMQFVVTGYDDKVGSDARTRDVTVEELQELWKNWPTHLNRAVMEASTTLCSTNLEILMNNVAAGQRASSIRPLLLRTPARTILCVWTPLCPRRRCTLYDAVDGRRRWHVHGGQLDTVDTTWPSQIKIRCTGCAGNIQ